jgi:hypothetical protein
MSPWWGGGESRESLEFGVFFGVYVYYVSVMDQTMFPSNSYEALNPSMTIFRDRVFRKVMKVK